MTSRRSILLLTFIPTMCYKSAQLLLIDIVKHDPEAHGANDGRRG
jgi:hypothetical protein